MSSLERSISTERRRRVRASNLREIIIGTTPPPFPRATARPGTSSRARATSSAEARARVDAFGGARDARRWIHSNLRAADVASGIPLGARGASLGGADGVAPGEDALGRPPRRRGSRGARLLLLLLPPPRRAPPRPSRRGDGLGAPRRLSSRPRRALSAGSSPGSPRAARLPDERERGGMARGRARAPAWAPRARASGRRPRAVPRGVAPRAPRGGADARVRLDSDERRRRRRRPGGARRRRRRTALVLARVDAADPRGLGGRAVFVAAAAGAARVAASAIRARRTRGDERGDAGRRSETKRAGPRAPRPRPRPRRVSPPSPRARARARSRCTSPARRSAS